tara:strand:- start:196 stop:453 length:258 start_codon:yes stop_codon:yes gene_type:complete
MPSPRVKNPGRTARFYRKNKKSREKHNDDNNKGGKYDKTKEYTRKHKEIRDKLKCKKSEDVVKKKGKWTCESLKINRARGGSKRK